MLYFKQTKKRHKKKLNSKIEPKRTKTNRVGSVLYLFNGLIPMNIHFGFKFKKKESEFYQFGPNSSKPRLN